MKALRWRIIALLAGVSALAVGFAVGSWLRFTTSPSAARAPALFEVARGWASRSESKVRRLPQEHWTDSLSDGAKQLASAIDAAMPGTWMNDRPLRRRSDEMHKRIRR